MKATKLVIGASMLIALAAVPSVTASETYQDRLMFCGDDVECIIGTSEHPDQRCSILDSATKTPGEDGDVEDCLGN